jgi:hypothetical protein
MTAKLLLAFFGAGVVALARCGGDDCMNANDHLAKCATNMSSSASSSGMMMAPTSCDGAAQCKAQCINQFTCSQINGNDPAYTMCLTACNGK